MADDGAVVQVDVDALRALADRFRSGGGAVEGGAGGLDRSMPPVPDDGHDLVRRFLALDEAREHFDRSLAGVLTRAGGRLALVVEAAASADAEGAATFADEAGG